MGNPGGIRHIAAWDVWIPTADKASLEGRVKELRALNNRLEARKSEFVTAQRIVKEKMEPAPLPALPAAKVDSGNKANQST